jgi:hypothetical protein
LSGLTSEGGIKGKFYLAVEQEDRSTSGMRGKQERQSEGKRKINW